MRLIRGAFGGRALAAIRAGVLAIAAAGLFGAWLDSGSIAAAPPPKIQSVHPTYFPMLRAASQRQPDNTPHARIPNLARARVVVK